MAKKSAADQPHPESKRGAKPLATVVLQGDVMDPDKLAARHGELVALSKEQQAAVDRFGDGLPWQPEHYESAIRIEVGRSADSFLRAGRLLLVARTCCAHGEWGEMLKRLNLGETTALHMMAWARQIEGVSNPARVQDLQAAATTIGRMIELAKLPPEQFKALAEEGQTGQLALDDVASMSRDELQAAVRDLRADKDAKDARISKLSDDVNKAEEKAAKAARKWKSASPDDQQVALEQRVAAAKHDVLANIGTDRAGLAASILELADHCNTHQLDCSQFLSDTLNELISAVRRVRDDYELGFDVALSLDSLGGSHA